MVSFYLSPFNLLIPSNVPRTPQRPGDHRDTEKGREQLIVEIAEEEHKKGSQGA
jgi:hypothetical protein